MDDAREGATFFDARVPLESQPHFSRGISIILSRYSHSR
jgi:hypothetical protein